VGGWGLAAACAVQGAAGRLSPSARPSNRRAGVVRLAACWGGDCGRRAPRQSAYAAVTSPQGLRSAARRAVINVRSAWSNPVDDRANERWWRMWSHREELLKVARRRSASVEDAEDAVHEAMLRAAEHPNVDDDRLGAWLTTVTMRLCADRYRQVRRDDAVHSRTTLTSPRPVPVDEVVCDRAEAEWLAERSKELPARQAKALRLKSEGRDVDQIAREMGLSYEAVESLLARARRALRRSLAGTMAVALWVWERCRGVSGGGVQVAAAATAASAAAVAILLASGAHAHHQQAPARAPTASATHPAAGPASPDRSADRGGVPFGSALGSVTPARPMGAPSDRRPAAVPSALPGVTVPKLPTEHLVSASPVPSLKPMPSPPSVPSATGVPPQPRVPVPGNVFSAAPHVPLTGR
jgi:RNA polymerase sigma factor (sigma-70 family)